MTIDPNKLIPPVGMVSINTLPNRIRLVLKAETWKCSSNVCCKLPMGSLTGCDFLRMSHSAKWVESLPPHTASTASGAGGLPQQI